ncbi:MAG: hypothetical protein KBD80_05710, partial [Acetatifactor sp.]|nr:hypothetical protein [Acetatifactor sp.]
NSTAVVRRSPKPLTGVRSPLPLLSKVAVIGFFLFSVLVTLFTSPWSDLKNHAMMGCYFNVN